MSSVPHLPAAQYLRMSTEHQQYSLDNQADADPAQGQLMAETHKPLLRRALR